MKRFVFALMLLLAGARAMPQKEIQESPVQGRIISGIVAGIVETVSQQIKDAGLDPYTMEKFELEYQLPVPVLFTFSTLVEELVVSGISNIVINDINYGLLNGRLRLDISLPEVAISLGGANVETLVLGSEMGASAKGRLAIIEPRIFGEVRVSLGISGISVKDVNLQFDLGGIQYEGNVNVLGYDLSDFFSELANDKIPAAIKENRVEINELINIIVWQVIDQLL